MGIFENFTTFLESRLEEFLQSNPHLNLTILAQELKTQKQETNELISNLQLDLKKIENNILSLGKEIKIWYERMEKAKKLERLDLANEAEKRKLLLLNEGNLLWHKMEETNNKIIKNKQLLISIETKEQEINLKIAQLKSEEKNKSSNSNTNKTYYSYNNSMDDLDIKFKQWEIEQELQAMKNKLNK